MLFNSLEYFIFLPLVFCFYWFVFYKNLRAQNLLLLLSSYIFYGWWDWRFLSLIILSTIIDYIIGLKIYNEYQNSIKKLYLSFSIIFNLGLLGFFKYFNFFIDSWIELLNIIGIHLNSTWTLNVILPVGISFYTFQTMSYSLDIYFKKIKPTKDFISFAAFVSFFPQLVAGPIERASNLLPQILKERKFRYAQAVNGLRLILWGLFKKVVIADTLSIFVDNIFHNYMNLNGGVLLLGLIYFSFQIYCDFSGYSDIAIGTSMLFGFELMSNFKFPYFSKNIGEFWRRWHISLSTWFRDYLYFPLGGSKKGTLVSIRNIIIIFIVSGFWHGANFTFLIWGFIHSMMYIPLFLNKKNREYSVSYISNNKFLPKIKDFLLMVITFSSTMVAWVFFRSSSFIDAIFYLQRLITFFDLPESSRSGIIYVIAFIIFEWIIRNDERNPLNFKNKYIRRGIYLVLSFFIIFYITNLDNSQFIYFQF
jgi:alginate O-acetyltransferase complex protein AlgI